MGIIETEIRNTINEHQISAHFMSREEYDVFIEKVCNKFSDTGRYIYPLWEHIKDSVSVDNEDSWKLICNFIQNNPCILFTERADESIAVFLDDGDTLMTLLANSFGFVFYITDADLNYIVCFNDHNFLIGSGSVEQWIL